MINFYYYIIISILLRLLLLVLLFSVLFVRLDLNSTVLPSFNGVPELLELGYFYATIGWRRWDSSSDTGDGPIVGYKIYVRSGSNVVLAKEVQHPSMVNNTDHSVSKRSAENASEMVMYNVSGLEAGSTYSVQIAAIRDGINGEGEQGPALTFTTNQGWHLKEMKFKIRPFDGP